MLCSARTVHKNTATHRGESARPAEHHPSGSRVHTGACGRAFNANLAKSPQKCTEFDFKFWQLDCCEMNRSVVESALVDEITLRRIMRCLSNALDE